MEASMDEVVYYLELKNHFYEKFLAISERFLAQTNEDRWEGLNVFIDNRERLLNIIQSYSYKISSTFDAVQRTNVDVSVYRDTIAELFGRRAAIGEQIVKVDLDLINKMEETRNDTIRELKKAVETGQAINSFAGPQDGRKGRKASKNV